MKKFILSFAFCLFTIFGLSGCVTYKYYNYSDIAVDNIQSVEFYDTQIWTDVHYD